VLGEEALPDVHHRRELEGELVQIATRLGADLADVRDRSYRRCVL
jgi:hypothetical protein